MADEEYFDTKDAKFKWTVKWKDPKDLTEEQQKEMLRIQKEFKKLDE